MIIKIYPQNPNEKVISRIVSILEADGVIAYPTDGVYAFGCSMHSAKAFEKIKVIKGRSDNDFSIMCADIRQMAEYVKVDNAAFKLLKRNLPGPFTFVMKALSKIPDKVLAKRKTIGVRISANPIPAAIIELLGVPLITSSVKDTDGILEYTTDPELIDERWGDMVDAVVDGGYGSLTPTTLVDMSGSEPEVLREGGGELIF